MALILATAAFLALIAITALGCWWLERPAREADDLGSCLRRHTAKHTESAGGPRSRVRFRPLSEQDRRGFLDAWGSVRDHFEADPTAAVVYADVLVSALMQQRETLEGAAQGRRRDQYRIAHEIATRQAQRPMSREDMARALGLYAVLFHELLPCAPVPEAEEGRKCRERGRAPNRVSTGGTRWHKHAPQHPPQ
jgi:hypothetical protein